MWKAPFWKLVIRRIHWQETYDVMNPKLSLQSSLTFATPTLQRSFAALRMWPWKTGISYC
ncbi:hypothetical protein MADA3029_490017 [Vibrio nigripulchritudo MADA3029]|uniref:Uncharacterized protein n=1 Tax=Vibrio nigripulchritudo SOn1 TaxID=1238450 RepID=A0AAV2VV40_9VIBR|nr:hypothetical protein VIBNIMADA3021_850017 [Vibrio nigripulchritudo MADA3021]CCN59841.1 hypothetical protein MADA3029_490017 [Vibrio nigripulchritudo MADA3029]CCN70328.1 hypothetical protein VIBNISFn118_20079 [Vibrio nigripulchritudo SFn118]CCN83548.1 hypothetical protein VIBNIBLFn1_620008 [Vibrio nigripulchritudo BLFn1]CCN86425.1 hypothetical protein VIBNISFn27_1050008 [Vibrio nigripulchritudo SFn27]CCN93416.1 hypothetical protein VIBNIENn2_210008 [Vibrio nigripulchritudo ENn2]CCO48295.1 h